MALSKEKRNRIIFKSVYYSITLAGLIAAACALYSAYCYINIPMAVWVLVYAFVALYLVVSFIFVARIKRGFNKFVAHCFLLQIIPIAATVLTFWVVSGEKHYKRLAGSVTVYEKEFNDMQDVQKAAALKNGLPTFASREQIEENYQLLRLSGKLVRISSNRRYVVRPLSYSAPYVVPKMEELLDDIGKAFQEKTDSKAKFVITSVLRTEEDIKKLQKENGNASSASCHCQATTVDISYVRFVDDVVKPRDKYELRLALSQVLHEFRKAGRCYIKFERKQYCYHITVR